MSKRMIWGFIFSWVFLVGLSFFWNRLQAENSVTELARGEARSHFEKDLLYRRWVNLHGGVYVPPTAETPPNPYLKDIPERDIKTPEGKDLTLVNPAYMTRQVHELAARQSGILGHITSLKPLRPENIPDEWERKALLAFESGEKEVSSMESIESKPFLRFMGSLITEKSCLKCHEAQGYKEGDIRGGISISVPFKPYQEISSLQGWHLLLGHGAIGILGIVGLWLYIRRVRRVEDSLRESEFSLKEAQIISGVGSYILDIPSGYWTSSEAFDQIFGIDESYDRSIEGWAEMVHRDDRAMMVGYFRDEVIGQGQTFDKVYRIVRQKDQIVRWAHGMGRLTFDEQSRPIVMRGTIQDITELKLAEEALKLSEERYRTTFQTSLDSIFITRLSDGLNLDINRGCTEILGYERDEVVGHTTLELGIWVDPDDRRQLVEILQRDSRCSNFEARFRRKNGEVLWGLMSATIMELNGVPSIITVTRDITGIKTAQRELELHRTHLEQLVEERTAELRETDARLIDTQFAMDSVGIGIQWVNHETGRLLYVNKAAAGLLGYRVEEMLELSVPDFDPDFDDKKFRQNSEIIRRQGHLRFESTHKTRDGRLLPVELTVYFKPGEADVPARHIVFLTDITQRKEAERMLLQAKEAAEVANRAKSTFLANMSHEIRTPLNGIVGMAHILRRGDVTPVQADRLNKIDAAAEHLLGTINDILDLSKIEAGKILLEDVPVDINRMLSNVNAILTTRAQAKGLHLRVETESLLPDLRGDPTRLQQALLNYAVNAIKFTESGTITLRTLIEDETPESVQVRFEVQDTGIGIPSAALSRLFAPFEQAENSTTRKYGGTGLGLAITRRLAELMGGEAGVESTYGTGSTFWFSARLMKRNEQTSIDQGLISEAEQFIREQHQGRRILIVDDEPLNLEVAKFLLEDIGLAVDTAEDGLLAVSKAREMSYAAILMDMQMPNLNGIMATQQIRELPAHRETPILAMTANAFVEDRVRCLDAGMNDFLAKPFNPDLLFSTLLRWLERRSDYANDRRARSDSGRD